MILAVGTRRGCFRLLACACALLLSSCRDDALLLGAKPDSPGRDASAEADAEGSDAGEMGAQSPLRARFEANGRLGIVRVEAACPSDCIELSVVAEGGVPPYEVVWDDGEVGEQRRLCIDPSRAPSVMVSDAAPGGAARVSLGLNAVLTGNCGARGVRACFVPERREVVCNGERREVFELGTRAVFGTLTAYLEYSPQVMSFFQTQAVFSDSDCFDDQVAVAGMLHDVFDNPRVTSAFSLDSERLGAFFYLRAIDQFSGAVETQLTIHWLEVCEEAEG